MDTIIMAAAVKQVLSVTCTHKTLKDFFNQLPQRKNAFLIPIRQVVVSDHHVTAQLSKNLQWKNALTVTVGYRDSQEKSYSPLKVFEEQTDRVADDAQMTVTLELHEENLNDTEKKEYLAIIEQFKDATAQDRETFQALEETREKEHEEEHSVGIPMTPTLQGRADSPAPPATHPETLTPMLTAASLPALSADKPHLDDNKEKEERREVEKEEKRDPLPSTPSAQALIAKTEVKRLQESAAISGTPETIVTLIATILSPENPELLTTAEFTALSAQHRYIQTAISVIEGYLKTPAILNFFHKNLHYPPDSTKKTWTHALTLLQKADETFRTAAAEGVVPSLRKVDLKEHFEALETISNDNISHILKIILTNTDPVKKLIKPTRLNKGNSPLIQYIDILKADSQYGDSYEIPSFTQQGLVFPTAIEEKRQLAEKRQSLIQQKAYFKRALTALEACLENDWLMELIQKKYRYRNIELAKKSFSSIRNFFVSAHQSLSLYLGTDESLPLKSEHQKPFREALLDIQRSSANYVLNQLLLLNVTEMTSQLAESERDPTHERSTERSDTALSAIRDLQIHSKVSEHGAMEIPHFSIHGLAFPSQEQHRQQHQERSSFRKFQGLTQQVEYLQSTIQMLELCLRNNPLKNLIKKEELSNTLSLLRNLQTVIIKHLKKNNLAELNSILKTVADSRTYLLLNTILENIDPILEQHKGKDTYLAIIRSFQRHHFNQTSGKYEVPYLTETGLLSRQDKSILDAFHHKRSQEPKNKSDKDRETVASTPSIDARAKTDNPSVLLTAFSARDKTRPIMHPPLPRLPISQDNTLSLAEKWRKNFTGIKNLINLTMIRDKIEKLLGSASDITVTTEENGDYAIQSQELGQYHFSLKNDMLHIQGKSRYQSSLIDLQLDVFLAGIKRHSDAKTITTISNPAKPTPLLEKLIKKLCHDSIKVIFADPLKKALNEYLHTFQHDDSRSETIHHIQTLLAKEQILIEKSQNATQTQTHLLRPPH